MIEIIKNASDLLLKYRPDVNYEWVENKLSKGEEVSIKNSFYFKQKNYLRKDEYEDYIFLLGTLKSNYYLIKKEILSTNFDVYIDKYYPINYKMFRVNLKYKNTFSALNDVYKGERLFIGGDNADISSEDFQEMIKYFPTKYETDLYVKSRIETITESYFTDSNNYNQKLSNYLEKKRINFTSSLNKIDQYDITKYKLILDHLQRMINEHTNYVEKNWQNEIIKIITLIMPQCIFTLKEISIKISSKKRRRIDVLLVNANGNVDIIEIKRYDSRPLIGKNPDSRGNYKPSSSLSSAIMQAEKYSYLCNTFSKEMKKEIEEKIKENYNVDFKVNILNPKTIIIMGNANEMDDKKRQDFELIRRMYSNVIDIITYGDLIQRLQNIIKALSVEMEDK